MTPGRLRVFHNDALGRYGFAGGHPFGVDRLGAFLHEFRLSGLDKKVDEAPPPVATEADLSRFHTPEYIARVKALSKSGFGYLDDGDTPAFPEMFEITSTVCGATIEACRVVTAGEAPRAFVPIAGLHHARRDAAAGFCVFNDIGVAIEWLRAVAGLHRIAYVDIDVHHGDGVFYSYEDDPEVVFADVHESGDFLYPGTGRASESGSGAAAGTKLNIPMPPGADDAAFRTVWTRVEEFVRAGKPEIIILQCGADSVAGDPLAHLAYKPETHGFAAARLRAVADDCCDGRLVALGGGGYNRENLGKAWCAVVEAMS
jgi:acetoin utilization protein AcuC